MTAESNLRRIRVEVTLTPVEAEVRRTREGGESECEKGAVGEWVGEMVWLLHLC